MDIAYPNIAERLFGRPHAIEPVALRAIMDGPLARRVLNGEKFEAKKSKRAGRNIRRDRLAAFANAEEVRSDDGIVDYALTPEGVAIIPVAGVLSRRFDWLAAACGWTTYEGLAATLDRVMSDQRARAILFDIDSPGGEADGMLDIGDAILGVRGKKEAVWAVANTMAASAAYAIGGSAEKLYLPRLAIVGSIGCVTIHVDQSRADKAEGLAYTAIYSGARKIDGWAHAPLSAEAESTMQSGVDYVRDQFASLVARQGRLSLEDALKTEASVYTDQQAVDAKLADGVMTFAEALARLTATVAPNSTGAFKMKQKATATADAQPNADAAATVVADAAAQGEPADATAVAATATAAAEAPASDAASQPRAEMIPPKPGEKCQLCGHVMDDPDDDVDDGDEVDPDDGAGLDARAGAAATAAGAAAAPATPAYGGAEMTETLELCAIAGARADVAQKFISAKTPIARVRAALADARAAASDGIEIIPADVDPSRMSQATTEARMKSWKDTQERTKREMGIRPRQ